MKPCIVYGLYSSRDGELRYIGQTTQPLDQRFQKHLHQAQKVPKQPAHWWLRRETSCGFTVETRVLCGEAVFNTTERELIAQHLAHGARLLNLTGGGGGVIGYKHTEEAKARISASKQGRPLSAEHKASVAEAFDKIHAAQIGVPLSREHRAKIAMALTGKRHTAEHSAKVWAARRANV